MDLGRLVGRAQTDIAERGLKATVQKVLLTLRDLSEYAIVRHRRKSAHFTVGGTAYPYFTHHYNATWRNERAVELPLVSAFLDVAPSGARVLEVGNVLRHYGRTSHVVVDKFETTDGVINQDILEYGEPQSFDVIVAISTLEHVGWDDTPREAGRAERAVAHMRSLLRDGGRLLVSVPIGYNPPLDRAIFQHGLGFRLRHFLQRVSADNRWREVEAGAVAEARYGAPYPCANALFIGID